MIRYHQITCPHCQGSGIARRHDMHEYTCPLCCGRGTINDFDQPIEEHPHVPLTDTSAELLARVIPLGGKTSGILLVHRQRRRQPQVVAIYSEDEPLAA